MYKYKSGKYVEDSTKGNSMINPRTFKNDAYVQVWLQSRDLATLDRWLESNGVGVRYLSEVIRESLKVLIDSIVTNYGVVYVESVDDAREWLWNRFRVNLNPGEKGRKNEMHNRILCNNLGIKKERDNDFEHYPEDLKKRIELAQKVARGDIDIEQANELKDQALSTIEFVDGIASFQNPAIDNIVNNPIDGDRNELAEMVKSRSRKPVVNEEIRKLTSEEIQQRAIELERKEREYQQKLKETSCVMPGGIKSID